MYGEARRRNTVRAAVVVAAATLLAVALPIGAPLYADVYPGPDADTVDEALTTAEFRHGFDSEEVTQFETTTFFARIVYGTPTPITPGQNTVEVAWSNEAVLTAQNVDAFDISPTSASRQFLSAGTRRPGGGYELTWTWDVTPLLAGTQSLSVRILPSVVVEGEPIPDLANINKPVEVDVDVHPVKHDFDEVLAAADSMKTTVPDKMTVGTEYDVSASLSLAGHADTVTADITLAAGADSAKITIVEASADSGAGMRAETVASGDGTVVRRWAVTADEAGQVALVFTAHVQGQAATHELEDEVPRVVAAKAMEPPPSFWDRLQQPVLYLTPFVVLAAGILGLWATWKTRNKRKAGAKNTDDDKTATATGDPAS